MDPDSDFNETINYFQNQGFTFSQDEHGNLFFTGGGTYSGSSIQLQEVVVNGIRYTKYDDNGSEKPFANGIATMLERFLEERDEGSDTGYDGSDGSAVDVNTYYDPWRGTGTNPGGGGGNSSTGDPWKKVNGELVITTTNDFSDKDYTNSGPRFDEVSLKMQKVTIKGANGEDITAYRVVSYTDSNGITHDDVPDKYKYNY